MCSCDVVCRVTEENMKCSVREKERQPLSVSFFPLQALHNSAPLCCLDLPLIKRSALLFANI